MGKISVIEKKSFRVGQRLVEVRRQNEAGNESPHQVRIRAKVKGITATETTSYPPGAVANCDEAFALFEEKKAGKFVERSQKFLGSKKGVALAAE